MISSSAFRYSPCFGVLPMLPSSDKTSALYLLQPVDGNIFHLHFQMTFNSIMPQMETRLLTFDTVGHSPVCDSCLVPSLYQLSQFNFSPREIKIRVFFEVIDAYFVG